METQFNDPAQSNAASYEHDFARIQSTDNEETVLAKARRFLDEAIELLNDLESISEVSSLLMELISDIDSPVIYAHRAAGALRTVLSRIVESKNRKLEAECFALSVGLTFSGSTHTEIARSHGVSKEAVSKRVREIQDEFGISSATMNKKSLSRDVYRMRNVRREKRKTDLD